MIDRLRRRLGRLRVTQRLALLVLVPLAAVVGLAIPVVTDRAEQAQAAASIADEATTRRAIGVLLEELQRERLLSLLYLSLPGAESTAVVRQSQAVNDAIEEVRTNADPRLRPGVARLTELLGVVRPRILDHSVLSLVAHTIFSQCVAAVLEALPPATAAGNSASVPPVAALDELLRANEQAARFGGAVLVIVTEGAGGRQILEDARTALLVYTGQFTQLASGEHRKLLTSAETSQAAQKVNELADAAVAAPTAESQRSIVVGRIAAAVETYTTLRRLVGDRIAREIVDTSASEANGAFSEAILVGLLALLLLLVVAGLAAAGARSIAVPLAQLNAAAVAVASATGRELERVSDVETQAESAPALRAVPTTGPGDVADLAAAFNQVQEGAAALLERQVTTRRNVSAMFATVARRTRNLADRQLNLIDLLERQQQDPQLLEKLYRLDHVATRLRRSASALLVVSGAADDPTGNPMRLADVVRAAAAEIEQFTRVQLIDAVDVAAVPRAVPDLILLVAELLDNAVSYSPPPAAVEVSVNLAGGGCRISISDVGIGMSAEQLAAENQRLIDRERLDIAPTQVLGLFVVGRLARRHNLTVTLQAHEPQGITVNIDLPGRLLTAPAGLTAPAPQPRGLRQAVRRAASPVATQLLPVPDRTVAAMRAVAADDRFNWFGEPDFTPMLPAAEHPAIAAGPSAAEFPRAGSPPAVPEPLVRPESQTGRRTPVASPMPDEPAVVPVEPAVVPVGQVEPAVSPAESGVPVGWAEPVGAAGRAESGTPAGRAEPVVAVGRAEPVAGSAAVAPAEAPVSSAPVSSAPVSPAPAATRAGLSRRVPGRNLPPGTGTAPQRDPSPIDPTAARAEAEAFTLGFARGVASVPGAMRPPPPAAAPPLPTFPPAGPSRPAPPPPPQWPLTAPASAQQSTPPAEPIGPVSSAPVSSAPVSPAPVSSAPVSSAPVSPAPVSSAPVSSAPVSSAPVSSAPVSPAPGDAERYPLPPRRVPARQPGNGPIGYGQPGSPYGSTPAQPMEPGEITQPMPAGAGAAATAAVADDESALTRRIPGSHLADELRRPGSRAAASAGGPSASSGPAQAPTDRDPETEQHQLDAIVAGFARGAAAAQASNGVPGRTPNAGPTAQFQQETTPSYQYDSGAPNGAEPQNVERR